MSAQCSTNWPAPIRIAPDKLAEIQAEFSRNWSQIAASAQQGKLLPPNDRRFATEAWASSPAALIGAHTYLLYANAIVKMVDAAQVDEPVRNRLHFSDTLAVLMLCSNGESQLDCCQSG